MEMFLFTKYQESKSSFFQEPSQNTIFGICDFHTFVFWDYSNFPLFGVTRWGHIIYYAKLTLDFQVNKKIAEEVATIPSKRLRNKIAGFTTHLMKRIQRGPVRGISLKLQEEERERRMEYVPDRSEVDVDTIQVDADTRDMSDDS